MAEKTRVAIGHRKSTMRSMLEGLCVRAGLEVVGNTSDRDAFKKIVTTKAPEVVILGHELPCAGDGEELANWIMESYPEVIVVNYSQVNWAAHITINPVAVRVPLLLRLLAAFAKPNG